MLSHTKGFFNCNSLNTVICGGENFTKTLTDGIYIWNCLAYDNSSQSDWANANWTINFSISNNP